MNRSLWATLALVVALPSAGPASTITTTFASNALNIAGAGVYFDLDVLNPAGIVIHAISVNTGATVGLTLATTVWVRPGTATGFESSTVGWTQVSSGTGTAAGFNVPSDITLTDFTLSAGLWGVAIGNTNHTVRYTIGNGSNQSYSNADVSLSLGSASSVLLGTTSIASPRVWNGSITYSVVPEPSPLLLSAVAAGVGASAWRLRRRAA